MCVLSSEQMPPFVVSMWLYAIVAGMYLSFSSASTPTISLLALSLSLSLSLSLLSIYLYIYISLFFLLSSLCSPFRHHIPIFHRPCHCWYCRQCIHFHAFLLSHFLPFQTSLHHHLFQLWHHCILFVCIFGQSVVVLNLRVCCIHVLSGDMILWVK
jgi:hypothetical protein